MNELIEAKRQLERARGEITDAAHDRLIDAVAAIIATLERLIAKSAAVRVEE